MLARITTTKRLTAHRSAETSIVPFTKNSRTEDGNDLGSSDGVEAKVKADHGGAGVAVDVQFRHVQRVHRMDVAMRQIPRRWSGADVANGAGIIS